MEARDAVSLAIFLFFTVFNSAFYFFTSGDIQVMTAVAAVACAALFFYTLLDVKDKYAQLASDRGVYIDRLPIVF